MLGRSINLITLFRGMLRPPKRLARTSCTHFCQELITALIEPGTSDSCVRDATACTPQLVFTNIDQLVLA